MHKKHYGGLEILKLVMSMMVVGIHTSPFASLPTLDAFSSNGLFRIAVPVFFLMNGYFLSLERDRFLPWMRRIVVLYLLLSLLFHHCGWICIHRTLRFCRSQSIWAPAGIICGIWPH